MKRKQSNQQLLSEAIKLTNLEYVEQIKDLYLKVEELQKAIPASFGYKLNSVLSSYHSIFERFCPFEAGDRVVLIKTPNIEVSSGWYGSRHFLIEGAIATVRRRDYYQDRFVFDLEFDDESWMDSKNEAHLVPLERRHVYNFGESWIKKA